MNLVKSLLIILIIFVLIGLVFSLAELYTLKNQGARGAQQVTAVTTPMPPVGKPDEYFKCDVFMLCRGVPVHHDAFVCMGQNINGCLSDNGVTCQRVTDFTCLRHDKFK